MSNNDEWLKIKLDIIESKVDKLDSRIDNIDVILGKQSVVLIDHTRRSLANERAVDLLKDQVELNKEIAQNDMKPVTKFIDQVQAILKLIGLFASLFAIFEGVVKLIELTKTFF